MMAYSLTKPLKLGGWFHETDGVYKFVLQEVNTTENDNIELRIADYYLYYPREDDGTGEGAGSGGGTSSGGDDGDGSSNTEPERRGWL